MMNSKSIDLKTSCNLYSSVIQKTLSDLFSVDFQAGDGVHLKSKGRVIDSSLDRPWKDELFFSILFTGEIYGEFIVSLKRVTAMRLLGIPFDPKSPEQEYILHREEILDAFKEVVNIAAGSTLAQFKKVFPDLSITPPKAIEGTVNLSNYQIEQTLIPHPAGDLTCSIYVDYMKLEVSKALESQKLQISLEHQKQEELKKLNRAKSEFLANMSHELRTPLNGMIGMLDVLKRSDLDQVQREQFDIVYRSGEFLLSLISDVLEISKIESGKLELEKVEFGLRESIEAVAESVSSLVSQKGLEFKVFIDPEIQGLYLGDSTKFKQVLINLLGNAIKFTPSGFLELRAEVLNNSHIKVQVKDTGIGIPKDKINLIFQSFTQADISDTRKYGGSGLGLTISKAIVEAMGGTISVESVEGKGSTFSAEVPLVSSPNSNRKDHKIHGVDKIGIAISEAFNLGSFERYINALKAGVTYDLFDEFKVQEKSVNFVSLDDWHKWSKEKLEILLSQLRLTQSRLVFVTKPQQLGEVRQIQRENPDIDIYFVNHPYTFESIKRVLIEKLTLRPASQSSNSQMSAIQSGQDKTQNRTRRVLVVEDNDVNQMVISFMLKKVGFEIHIAKNGQEAVNLFKELGGFDLILMDCQMPVMDGYEATQILREYEFEQGLSRTPIIALTANVFKETKEACFAAGMDDFASKPIRYESLSELIEKSMQRAAKKN